MSSYNDNITFDKNNIIFNFRVAGIVLNRGRLLLHTTAYDDFWNLPGGRVKFNETTEASLIREFEEELGVHIEIEQLAYVNEDFFVYNEKKVHEIGFYYVVRLSENQEITSINEEFKGLEDNGKLTFKWFALEELQDMEVYPTCLKTEVSSMENMKIIKHHIERQV